MASFLKFLVVGTIGFIINTVGLLLGVKIGISPSLAGPIGAEFAIVSNFILNNFWTFSDRSITSWDAIPMKFITFNLLSFGAVIIQFLSLKAGELIFGIKQYKKPAVEVFGVLKWPVIGKILESFSRISIFQSLFKKITVYFIFYVAGVAVGLVVNYFIYSVIIWKK